MRRTVLFAVLLLTGCGATEPETVTATRAGSNRCLLDHRPLPQALTAGTL